MKKVWQHVLGRPYILYKDSPPNENPSSPSEDTVLIIPTVFSECQSFHQKVGWVESSEGQAVIQSRPLLKHYYETGYLFKILENPLWETRLKEWFSVSSLSLTSKNIPYGLTLPRTDEEVLQNQRSWLHDPHQNPPLELVFQEYYEQFYYYTFPEDKKRELYDKGFTVLSNIIPQHMIDLVTEKINDYILDTDLYFDILHNEKHYEKDEKKGQKWKEFLEKKIMRKKDKMSKDKDHETEGSSTMKGEEESRPVVMTKEEWEKQQEKEAKVKGKEGKDKNFSDQSMTKEIFLGSKEKQKKRLENRALQMDNGDGYFVSGTTNDLTVLSLYYATPLHAMIESLLHGSPTQYTQKMINDGKAKTKPGHVLPTEQKEGDQPEELRRPFRVATSGCQVAYRFSQPLPGGNSSSAGRLPENYMNLPASQSLYNRQYPPLGGNGWHVDGLGRGQWGTFSFLIGIPLNNQFEEYSGNLCLHEGSHYTLQPYMKEYANRFNATDSFEERFALARNVPKPMLNEPTQITAAAGDVIIALHKVAHLGGPNYSNEIRKMLYFRISHSKHQELRFAALDDLWIEYEGMQDILS
jgi:hypothetical protein